MPTFYIYGTILTDEATAANNRGDNIGNTTTLQKVFVKDDIHTSVSAEAIRFALRYRFQMEFPDLVNRSYDSATGRLTYQDEKRSLWNPTDARFIDDDLMGFMDAAAAKVEKEDEGDEDADEASEATKPKAKKKAKGSTTKRQSPLAIGRAISLRPYRGELSFNCVSGDKEKGKLSLYSAEMHTTEYQYSFGLNLGDVASKENIGRLLDAVVDPPQVAGNHSRFFYDFSPASIVLRVTTSHSSKIQNCFEHNELLRSITFEKLVRRVESGDIPASELFVGGDVSSSEEGQRLKELGVAVFGGVSAAMNHAKDRIAKLDKSLAVVAPLKGVVS
ncbi:MAG: DevR family CRISPR-associated autoregulator [Candidatus Obscuribacterales bacterium]|nr:DevR family CRISPR-associated autoregulator [Candidatus Obscuribacterales bacterium]